MVNSIEEIVNGSNEWIMMVVVFTEEPFDVGDGVSVTTVAVDGDGSTGG